MHIQCFDTKLLLLVNVTCSRARITWYGYVSDTAITLETAAIVMYFIGPYREGEERERERGRGERGGKERERREREDKRERE